MVIPDCNEQDFGDTRADGSPIGREPAALENSVFEEDPAERARLAAEEIRVQEVLGAPMRASMQQDDVGGQGTASAPVRNLEQVVPEASSEATSQAARLTTRIASREEMLQQAEPEVEVEHETDVMPTLSREPDGGVETPPPRTSSQFYEIFPDVLNGSVRRATLHAL